ncbi:BCCT family transporter [Larsenimonas rhizosphaerae]|uniref:BCCT family transporter n=1 Tax=Larsenimonas rhizosphaerae TaxID=2944682 RepID=A0AA41ZNI3_9GAMM|nr:BCCT family transporter [Larsenimonas rhizosphaerae]MCM2129519.1 BCCT family transporter [Larsenimonas rhizosphaerae]MCX2524175.1 BCCT family transporter [Larsenimonas rhizosphaerae]
MGSAFSRIDKVLFFGVLLILFSATVPLVAFPTLGASWVAQAKNYVTDNFGVAYLALGISSFGFMIYIIFSDIGQIKLGEPEEKPEFHILSWAAMLFCAGIGGAILYWSMIEWVYYMQAPPFNAEPFSEEAVTWATTYGIFHWGPLAWSMYLVPALPIAYFVYVRKRPVLRISEALLPVLGETLAHGWLGKLVDILFIFGMLGGGATSLGLLAPLINESLGVLFGVPTNLVTQLLVLMVCTIIFASSAYVGLSKGIKLLSDINLWLALGLLAFVLVVGPTQFLLKTGLNAIGTMAQNLIHMATWTEPFGNLQGFPKSSFPENWTIFYWAWWLVFAPTVGLFIARISRGRTIRTMVAGSLFFGTLGCALFFSILGNYAIYLQLTDALDVVSILNNQSPEAAILAVLNSLPLSWLVIAVFTILLVIFTATTFDSISYILASVVEYKMDETGEPMRWNRLFWAFAMSILPMTLLFLGGLSTLQTAAVVSGVPLLVVAVLLMISTVRAARFDLRYQPHYDDPQINIQEFPEADPWTEEGSWEEVNDENGASLTRSDKGPDTP